ncbi:MAG: hypothetical protein IJC02_01150 [Lachnospiraceae bacterium]|nr:hypothetical protein [Tyzzerella sp.]MBQ3163137.1 hypothetical protein [Lachnospiraceae bacterium]
MDVEVRKASTALTGFGVAAIGVTCMASSTVTVPLAVADYAAYNVDALITIGGICGG